MLAAPLVGMVVDGPHTARTPRLTMRVLRSCRPSAVERPGLVRPRGFSTLTPLGASFFGYHASFSCQSERKTPPGSGVSELGAAPCVDGTGFDTCRHLGCRRAFGRSGSEIASPSIAWDSSRRSGIPCCGQDCYGKKSFVRGLHESFSTPLRVACHQPHWSPSVVTERPIRAVFCARSPETRSKSAGY